jgi:hypothetical protein
MYCLRTAFSQLHRGYRVFFSLIRALVRGAPAAGCFSADHV